MDKNKEKTCLWGQACSIFFWFSTETSTETETLTETSTETLTETSTGTSTETLSVRPTVPRVKQEWDFDGDFDREFVRPSDGTKSQAGMRQWSNSKGIRRLDCFMAKLRNRRTDGRTRPIRRHIQCFMINLFVRPSVPKLKPEGGLQRRIRRRRRIRQRRRIRRRIRRRRRRLRRVEFAIYIVLWLS